jgi:hypothetical protein
MKSKEQIVELIEQLKFDLEMEKSIGNKLELKKLRDKIVLLGWVIS